MIKAIIVEDEPWYTQELKKMLDESADIKVVAVCETVERSIEMIKNHNPDLVFLDIELDEPEGGFKILRKTSKMNYGVIFTTGHNEHAMKAFEFSAVHFLDKPVDPDKLAVAIQRFKQRQVSDSKKSKEILEYNVFEPDFMKRIFVVREAGIERYIPVSKIIMCVACDNYTLFYLTEDELGQMDNEQNKLRRKQIVTNCQSKNDSKETLPTPDIATLITFEDVVDLLSDQHFYRCHRKYLVNLNHVKGYRVAELKIELPRNYLATLARPQK